MTKRLFTAAAGDPPTLVALVSARLALDAGDAAQLIARGSAHVDGRRCTDPDAPIAAGARVAVHLPRSAAPSAPAVIVHRDEWLIIVDKPAGVSSQATPSDSAGALDAQVARLQPGARLLHRLDRDASGLVLFAARPDACAPLQALLEAGRIDRRYLAVAGGRLGAVGESGRIALRIARHPSDSRLRAALPEAAPAGQAAESRYLVLGHAGERTALELTLSTGRTHQLRVHLAAIGHPIAGDRLYGGAPAERLCLHAHRLSLPHPRDGRELVAHSPAPPELTRLVALTTPPA